MEAKIVYFLTAFLVSLAGVLVTNEGYPGHWQMVVAIIFALGQGTLAWRLFVAKPPQE